MSGPDDDPYFITAEVRNRAEEVVREIVPSTLMLRTGPYRVEKVARVIAAAVEQEREACARAAEGLMGVPARQHIAAAIRRRSGSKDNG